MNGRASQIGFSQRIRLEWLEKTANLVLAGNDKAAVKDSLQELLRDKVSIGGQAIRGNREKVITILMKTWLTVPRGLKLLRDEGLQIHQRLHRKERIVVHWGMAMAAYPFWGVVAAHTTLPVIGIPVPTKDLGGMDSLLATVQMPSVVFLSNAISPAEAALTKAASRLRSCASRSSQRL